MVTQSSDAVVVDLPGGDPTLATPPPPRRRLGTVAAVAVAAVAALVLWPDAAPPSSTDAAPSGAPPPSESVPPPDHPQLLPWPGRGPWAADAAFVADAAAAWAAHADLEDGAGGPGEEVHPLWAGPVGTVAVAVLQSVGPDGVPRVAQVSESRVPGSQTRSGLTVRSTAELDGRPELIALAYTGGYELDGLGGVLDEPGAALVQVLPGPELLSDGVELQRLDGPSFQTVGMRADGLSQPWVHSPWMSATGPIVAVSRTRGPDPGLVLVRRIDPGDLMTQSAPVALVPPEWGRLRASTAEDYVDASYALEHLGRASGRVAILGSTPLDGGRVSLVEVRPSGPGDAVVMTVLWRPGVGRVIVSDPRPAGPADEMVLGAVRTPAGELVVVGTGPPEVARVILGADGDAIASGPRTTVAWLGRGQEVEQVAAQGYRRDEVYVGRTALDLGDL